jgi:hypothetical protein
MRKTLGTLAGIALAAFGATTASAQQATDYVIQQYAQGSRYESPPASATTESISGDDADGTVTLPFAITYFGTSYTSATVHTNGWMSFVLPSGTYAAYSSSSFPLMETDSSSGTSMYGTICPYWDDLMVTGSATIKSWTVGTTPNRRFVISWEGVTDYNTQTASCSFQVKLYESSNSIEFGYSTSGTWPPSAWYTAGIEAADGRYQYPSALSNGGNSGQPPYDFSFDLPKIYVTGRVIYDRYVVSESGGFSGSQANLPLAGFRVEARNASNVVVGATTTDANGDFVLEAAGVPPSAFGSVVVCSQTTACAVRGTTGGPLYTMPIKTNLSYAADVNIGTISLHEGVDSGGVGREPLNIARTIQTVATWASSRMSGSIPFLEVLYSASQSASTYTAKVGTTPALMRVGGTTANRDAWDLSVIRKTYGRHVLGALATDPTSSYSPAFDAVSDPQNAFAEGFGYYLNAVISGDRKYLDVISSSATNAIDLEDAQPTTRKGADVAAWVAQALYDLTDGANEEWDVFAGAFSPGEQAFLIVDSLSAPVTATTFFNAWLNAGYDGPALSRNFIHHGLISDDDDEPNEDSTTAAPISTFGFLKKDRVLNLYNADWYEFTLPEATTSLTASVYFDRVKYSSSQVALELRSAGNSVLAVGSAADAAAPFKLTTNSLPAGLYRLAVSLNSGGPVGAYTIQAFSQLKFKAAEFQPWTVGRPYNVPLTITGGIPPYILTIPSNHIGPAGLVLDGENSRVTGTPSGPAAGVPKYGFFKYDFLMTAQDSAQPPNQVQGLQSFTLNDIVRSRFNEFVTFADGKTVDRQWPPIGGTPQYTASIDQGQLPNGLSVTAGADVRFVGTPETPGSNEFKVTTTDSAGSAASTLTTAVVCVPAGLAELAAGKSACGFYVDALKGSSVTLTVTTSKKKPVRALRVVLYDVDGSSVLPTTPKLGKGRATVPKFTAPNSGRYFCVVASDDELDATQLKCVAKVIVPKVAKGDAGSLAFGGDDRKDVQVGLLSAGTLTLTLKPDRKSGLHVKVLEIRDPTGAVTAPAETELKTKGGVVTFTRKVDVAGTWTVVIGAEPGPRGTFTYVAKLKQPKGVYLFD